MSWRKTIILALALLVFAIGYWWFEIHLKTKHLRTEIEKTRLLENVYRIKRFRIETRSGSVEVAQDSITKRWNVVFPVFYPTDNDEVQNVLRAALGVRYTDVIADSGNPSDYGFAPSPWVKFSAEGKTFYLGDETPTHNGVYAQIDGDSRILLVDKQFRTDLLKLPLDLRDKSILPEIDVANLDTVKIIRPSGKITITRKGFRWWLTSPIIAMASNKIVDDMLDKLISAKAFDFAAENYADSTIKKLKAKIYARIIFYMSDSAEYSMNIYISDSMNDTMPEFVYASTNVKNPLFEISEDIYNLIRTPAELLRERRLFRVGDADRFVITGPNDFKFECKFRDGNWFLIYPDSGKANNSEISKMLDRFDALFVDSFVNDSNFKPSGWKFSFYIGTDSIPILIGDTSNGEIQIKKDGEKEYYLVQDKEILNYCEPDRKKFFNPY